MRTFDRGVDVANADDATLERELEYTLERMRGGSYAPSDPRMETVRSIVAEQNRRASDGGAAVKNRALRREQPMSVMTLTEDLQEVIPEYAPQLAGLGNAFWIEVAARLWLARYGKS